jgi:L,D-transpeptidase catalytic domain
MNHIGRRAFLGSAAAMVGGAACAGLPLGSVTAQSIPQPTLNPLLLTKAASALASHGSKIFNRDLMAIADFSQASAQPRFHLFNMIDGSTTTLLVSHGIGSDRSHSGWVQEFSNIPGSEATSSGAYLVGESYIGKYGASRRLIGLDRENDQAENRAIVIHPAWYVSQNMAAQQGKIGRSQGCFAFSFDDIGQVLSRLAPGSLLYAGKA